MSERSYYDATIPDMEKHAPAIRAAGVLRDQRDLRLAEGAPAGLDVPVTHVHATLRQQRREHARPADELRLKRALGAELPHLLEQERNGRSGEFGAIVRVARHALGRQKNVRE